MMLIIVPTDASFKSGSIKDKVKNLTTEIYA